jgi:hypothetical protein
LNDGSENTETDDPQESDEKSDENFDEDSSEEKVGRYGDDDVEKSLSDGESSRVEPPSNETTERNAKNDEETSMASRVDELKKAKAVKRQGVK